jgi:RNA polymerase sigma-70 factor (ECF subfamily)
MMEKGPSPKNREAFDFAELHRVFRPKIFRYLCGLVGEAEAEDLAQEVFLKVSRGLQKFRGQSQLSTWIYRIATNAAIDRLKKPSVKPLPLEGAGAGHSAGRTNIEAGASEACADEKSPAPETSVIEDEMLHCLLSFINKLPAGQRPVVTLNFFEGLNNAEIAEILRIDAQTVKMRLQRARARLVAELETHCGWFRDARKHLTWDGRIIL